VAFCPEKLQRFSRQNCMLGDETVKQGASVEDWIIVNVKVSTYLRILPILSLVPSLTVNQPYATKLIVLVFVS